MGDIGDGVLTVNLLEGRLGIVLDWEKPIRGSGHILYVTFEVAKGASGRMPLTLTDSVAARAISDRQGETHPANWIGGVVVVRDRGLDRLKGK